MYGGRDVFTQLPALAARSERQSGILTRRQLAAYGVDNKDVDAHGEGSALGSARSAPRRHALRPADVRGSALGGSAQRGSRMPACAPGVRLQQWGLRGWDRDRVHVVVARGQTPEPLPWVQVHESRRHGPEDLIRPESRPPTHDVARATVDAAAWERVGAVGVRAAGRRRCNSDLTTADRSATAPSTWRGG